MSRPTNSLFFSMAPGRRLRPPPLARPVRLVTALIACTACAGVAASEWTLVPESSTVRMWATKQGAWFDGSFEEFTATIVFDPDTPASGSVVGIVETGSIETQDEQNDNYVRGYLDVGEFPEARFESTTIEQTAEGFRAVGDLTLKGLTRPATLDFTFTRPDGSSGSRMHARFSGVMTINRYDFDIASDVDINQAGRDVTVQVELDLVR